MYDNRWYKKIKEINYLSEKKAEITDFSRDLAVIELEEAIEQEYVKPACFSFRIGKSNYSFG